ncbi:hypothetical protein CEY04_17820 [Achromobacter sp. HZ28]|nr:hypothetical protein CEY04_17820 [Achromobacter sp. HZ28]OWT76105.1 hypothetical protein CEY05_13270 [Achromobacter sp. HZ34]
MSFEAGLQAIENGEVFAAITDGYLILYEVGAPWYATAPLWIEQMVLRLEETPGNYNTVLRAIDALVDYHGCVGAVTGNAVGRRGLTRAYERDGYTVAAIQLLKEKN